jgi:hypothetical protein
MPANNKPERSARAVVPKVKNYCQTPRWCQFVLVGSFNGDINMNMPAKLFAVALLAAGTCSMAVPAGAAPITAPLSLQNTGMSSVETVQWRRGWRGRGGWGWGPGIAAGLIVGGAIAASQYPYGYGYGYAPYGYGDGYGYGYAPAPGYAAPGYAAPGYAAPGYAAPGYAGPGYAGGDAVAYCSQRFRSYDPASGTYLGYDNQRHPCP